MSVADDELTLQQLEQEKATLENRPHNGYADVARVTKLNSDIQTIEDRITRKKQRAQYGEG